MALTKKLGFDYCYGGAWVMSVDCYRGKKRPGQWGDATRDKRRRRADRVWWRRALNVWHLRQGNRAERRREKRAYLEKFAAERALVPRSDEFTAELAMRVRLSFAPTHLRINNADIEIMGAERVDVDYETHTVRVTMPADTSAAHCCDVSDEISARLPAHVALTVETDVDICGQCGAEIIGHHGLCEYPNDSEET